MKIKLTTNMPKVTNDKPVITLDKTSLPPHHAEIIKRLKRANGHLNKVIGMLEQENPCLDITQQLHAVEKAIMNAKQLLIHDHINHCLEQTTEHRSKQSQALLNEFKTIARYL